MSAITPIQYATTTFLHQLLQAGFGGDIEESHGARIVAATDNSVYQVIPQAIIYPRSGSDITLAVQTLAQQPEGTLSLVARGGCTGTNGQSLNDGVVLDTSRYLNHILSIDTEAQRVTVEPGVILDQLNESLAHHGLFFPPDVSSGSRATIGGMVATDASGKGSRIHGKTSDYIESLDVVLTDGSELHVAPLAIDQVRMNAEAGDLASQAQRTVLDIISAHRRVIKQTFPAINRGLTGYNLKQVVTADGAFRLSYLLAGSEGTLAITRKITLRVIPKPRFCALIVVIYDDFSQTLSHIARLLEAEPVAIEVLDDNILQMAQQDAVWQDVQASFGQLDTAPEIRGLSFIEVNGNSKADLQQRCQSVEQAIAVTGEAYGVLGTLVETNAEAVAGLWSIRRRAVGLLGAMRFEQRRPIAFVEDTAVPPDQLPAYIADFRQILDQHGLHYGMYGHADVGCLHVRPALDMRQREDQQLLRTISDQVAALVHRYGGVFWGEHGRGFRGEFAPLFFGPQLTPLLQQIKAAFDPDNRFNPGKLATTGSMAIRKIDTVPFRGHFDAQLGLEQTHDFALAVACNGNAACHNISPAEAMCPSYKALHDKRFGPKGRAAMLREWARLTSITDSRSVTAARDVLEQELHQSLQACLSCKSCAHSCPIKVDIPELKSRFLQQYHQRHLRPLRDYLFAHLEKLAAIGRKRPTLTNTVLQNGLTKVLLQKFAGLTALPAFSPPLKASLQTHPVTWIDPARPLPALPRKAVILLPDSFNASFDSPVLLAACEVITALGYHVAVAPVLTNGKAQHVKGFRSRFRATARQHRSAMETLASTGLPLLSVEVVTRLMHDREYPEILGEATRYRVVAIESWLRRVVAEELPDGFCTHRKPAPTCKLLPHCMEQTAAKHAIADWRAIFSHCGIPLEVTLAGCCGMSGLFGHELINATLAKRIFQQNWAPHTGGDAILLASGFSCRCQLRSHGNAAQHPIELIAASIRS